MFLLVLKERFERAKLFQFDLGAMGGWLSVMEITGERDQVSTKYAVPGTSRRKAAEVRAVSWRQQIYLEHAFRSGRESETSRLVRIPRRGHSCCSHRGDLTLTGTPHRDSKYSTTRGPLLENREKWRTPNSISLCS